MITKMAWIMVSATALLGLRTVALLGQSVISAKAGLVSYAEGKAFIEDRAVEISAVHFPEVKENAVVRTEAGRAEVLLGPCAVMWIGENTSFRMIANRLTDARVELLSGSAVVEVGASSNDNKLTLSVKTAGVSVNRKGLYRFDAQPPQVKVSDGAAAVGWANQSISVGPGRMLFLDGGVAVRKFDKRNPDSLDDWARRRALALAKAGDSHLQERRARELAESAGAAANVDYPLRSSGDPNFTPVSPTQRGEGPSPIPGGALPVNVSASLGCAVSGR